MIINADDFGMNHEKNIAIDKMMRNGICTSASLIVNMEYTNEAIELAKEGGYINKLSLHLNLTQGKPLSEKIKKVSLYCSEGEFIYNPIIKKYNQILPKHISALRDEIESQILYFEKECGNIHHIDSHNWVHLRYPVWRALKPLIAKYKIESIRPMWNGYCTKERGGKWAKYFRLAKITFLRNRIFQRIPYSSNIEQYLLVEKELRGKKIQIVEVFTHPELRNDMIMDLSSSYTKKKQDTVQNNVSKIKDVEFVSFEEIKFT